MPLAVFEAGLLFSWGPPGFSLPVVPAAWGQFSCGVLTAQLIAEGSASTRSQTAGPNVQFGSVPSSAQLVQTNPWSPQAPVVGHTLISPVGIRQMAEGGICF